MNIQARKPSLIEDFLRIADESLIEKLESLIRIEKKKHSDRELKPMSLSEFHKMIDQARQDKAEDRIISHEELKKDIKSWKFISLNTLGGFIFVCDKQNYEY
ncbi:MAG TPA: hypothetical protein ENN08_03080 [Bacteroidales bacterium]|nr:hypothetical protein [Bacteroidales bacterium]